MIAPRVNHLMDLKHVSPFRVQWQRSFNVKIDKKCSKEIENEANSVCCLFAR